MRILPVPVLFLALGLALAVPSAAQVSLEVTNARGVVCTCTHATTGVPYPWWPTTPPGYQTTGVAPGTRCWTHAPRHRLTAGHQGSHYLTITGFTQWIRPGAGTLQFPSPGHYQFATGIAPVQQVSAAHRFEHAPTGNDIVYIPQGTVHIPSAASFQHNFTLGTPIVIQDVELCLFAEYDGGEQQDDPVDNQVLRADWRGGPPAQHGTYYGFTVGSAPRTVTLTTDPLHVGQVGLLVQEPIFTPTGFHANNYDPNPPLTGEDFRGIAAAFADWSTNGSVNSTLFFDFRAGPNFANGTATLLTNLQSSEPPIKIPTLFGNLMLFPMDPLFTIFADGGVVLPLDPVGDYTTGMTVPIPIPAVPGLAGAVLSAQGIVVDAALQNVALTNRSSIRIY